MTITEPSSEQPASVDAFAERVLASALGAIEILSLYVGDRLGWYRALSDGPATSAELASRTGTHERYAREWLEQQAVVGILTTDASQSAAERRYTLSAPACEVLTDESSLAYLGPLPRMLAASAVQLPALLNAYRTGGGVSWDQFGDDARWAQADINRPWFERELAGALSSVADLHELLSRPDVRIADIGCGAGWSTIALAHAYPNARIDGLDVDAPSIEVARGHARDAGVGDRVAFELADGNAVAQQGTYDAAFAFECVHDMAQPVEVLAGIRAAVKPDGAVVIMDEAVGETFAAPSDDLERLMYGFSLFVCLPDGMSSAPSAGTGTVMRPSTLTSYAQQAGFERVEVLPIEDFAFFRFYRLHH
jgi:predicted O-methyltransferase YrrM